MTRIEKARQWITEAVDTAGYRWSYGAWTEQPGRIIALYGEGGRRVADESYPVVRVVVVGDRDKREDTLPVLRLAEALQAKTFEDTCAGDAVRVTAIGGIVGPGYTAEGRAWVELNLEFLI